MTILRKLLSFLRVEKSCKSGHGHSWELNWDMQPSFCIRCGLRHDDRFNRED